jgi:hypothetical protein
MIRTTAVFLAFCILFVPAGCSSCQPDYSKVELVNVTGTVTLDNTPVAAAVVSFESTSTGSFSAGMTDVNGRYELRFDSARKGVTPGNKLVQVSTSRRLLGVSDLSEADDNDPADDSLIEQIPTCYHKDSQLNVDVTRSTTRFDFDLKSDCSTTGAK